MEWNGWNSLEWKEMEMEWKWNGWNGLNVYRGRNIHTTRASQPTSACSTEAPSASPDRRHWLCVLMAASAAETACSQVSVSQQ